MKKNTDILLNEPIKEIESFIKAGVKIIKVDKEKQEVSFVECVLVEEGRTKPFYISIPVPEKEQLKKILSGKKFKEATFNPVDRGILLLDVAGYSRHDTLYQASILSLFNQSIKQALKKIEASTGKNCLEQLVPTGDGCFVIFNPCVNTYLLKVAYTLFSEMNKVQDQLIGKFSSEQSNCENMFLRIGCTIGETDFFFDPTGKRNCYGLGMNEAERILSLGQSGIHAKEDRSRSYDSFFLDKSLKKQAEELLKELELKDHHPRLDDLGMMEDKHGISRNIFWLHNLPPMEDIEF